MKKLEALDVLNWMRTAKLKTDVRGYFQLSDMEGLRAITALGQAAKRAGFSEFRMIPTDSGGTRQRVVWVAGEPTGDMVDTMTTFYYEYTAAAEERKQAKKAAAAAAAAEQDDAAEDTVDLGDAPGNGADQNDDVAEVVDNLEDIQDLFKSPTQLSDKSPIHIANALMAESNIKLDQVNSNLEKLINIWQSQDSRS